MSSNTIKYNPALSEDENLKALLLDAGYPDEFFSDIQYNTQSIQAIRDAEAGQPNTELTLSISGRLQQALKKATMVHQYTRVPPLPSTLTQLECFVEVDNERKTETYEKSSNPAPNQLVIDALTKIGLYSSDLDVINEDSFFQVLTNNTNVSAPQNSYTRVGTSRIRTKFGLNVRYSTIDVFAAHLPIYYNTSDYHHADSHLKVKWKDETKADAIPVVFNQVSGRTYMGLLRESLFNPIIDGDSEFISRTRMADSINSDLKDTIELNTTKHLYASGRGNRYFESDAVVGHIEATYQSTPDIVERGLRASYTLYYPIFKLKKLVKQVEGLGYVPGTHTLGSYGQVADQDIRGLSFDLAYDIEDNEAIDIKVDVPQEKLSNWNESFAKKTVEAIYGYSILDKGYTVTNTVQKTGDGENASFTFTVTAKEGFEDIYDGNLVFAVSRKVAGPNIQPTTILNGFAEPDAPQGPLDGRGDSLPV